MRSPENRTMPHRHSLIMSDAWAIDTQHILQLADRYGMRLTAAVLSWLTRPPPVDNPSIYLEVFVEDAGKPCAGMRGVRARIKLEQYTVLGRVQARGALLPVALLPVPGQFVVPTVVNQRQVSCIIDRTPVTDPLRVINQGAEFAQKANVAYVPCYAHNEQRVHVLVVTLADIAVGQELFTRPAGKRRPDSVPQKEIRDVASGTSPFQYDAAFRHVFDTVRARPPARWSAWLEQQAFPSVEPQPVVAELASDDEESSSTEDMAQAVVASGTEDTMEPSRRSRRRLPIAIPTLAEKRARDEDDEEDDADYGVKRRPKKRRRLERDATAVTQALSAASVPAKLVHEIVHVLGATNMGLLALLPASAKWAEIPLLQQDAIRNVISAAAATS